MKTVKVYGAGSIGNHLANASRRMGWQADICDTDPEALRRTREEIYPARYGKWDDSIGLYTNDNIPSRRYDLIIIGTPPDSHMRLARQAVKERPAAILVEKPLCTPDLNGAQELLDEASAAGVHVFTGYDHVVGKSAQLFGKLLRERAAGEPDTLDVEFREYWGGIFAAHPWLNGPSDTYLGFWQRGGGSCGEHSHAANLWQYFAHEAGAGRIVEVSAEMEFVRDSSVDYDKLCLMTVRTESGLVGRVVQDVVTRPTRKWARMQGSAGYLEWFCGHEPGIDSVIHALDGGVVSNTRVSKTRPDDFVQELKHIESALAGTPADSPISLVRGLETMMVIAAAHKSATEKRAVRIDYSKGYVPEALN
jgi:predicted dehydrogenase